MAERRAKQDNPLIRVTPFDPRPYRESDELVERRWREEWVPNFGLDPKLYGRERALAMAKATGLTNMIPRTREPGEDDE